MNMEFEFAKERRAKDREEVRGLMLGTITVDEVSFDGADICPHCMQPVNREEDRSKNASLATSRKIIEYLNQKTGRSFKGVAGDLRKIKARLSEGFTFTDFTLVIDKKVADWAKDKRMSSFLRPETLFGSKFDGYLQEAIQKGDKNGTGNAAFGHKDYRTGKF